MARDVLKIGEIAANRIQNYKCLQGIIFRNDDKD